MNPSGVKTVSEENRIELNSLEYVMVNADPEKVQEVIENIKATSPYGPKDVLIRAGEKEHHMKYKWPEGYTVTELDPIPVEINAADENAPENPENKPAGSEPENPENSVNIEPVSTVVSDPEIIPSVVPENKPAEPDTKQI